MGLLVVVMLRVLGRGETYSLTRSADVGPAFARTYEAPQRKVEVRQPLSFAPPPGPAPARHPSSLTRARDNVHDPHLPINLPENRHRITTTAMPGSEYTAVTGGALKLKGGAPIDKKKKKKKSKTTTAAAAADAEPSSSSADAKQKTTAMQRALADEDEADEKSVVNKEDEEKELGRAVSAQRHKTEAERKYEERRRKRVSAYHWLWWRASFR